MLISEARVLLEEETGVQWPWGGSARDVFGGAAWRGWSEMRGSGRRRGHAEVGGWENHRRRSGFRCYLRWEAIGEF